MGGVKCRVHYINNKIEVVEAPNGAYSTLYQEALDLTKNEDEALKIWASAYTDKFLNYNEKNSLDKNNEPLLKDVLNFIEQDTYFSKELTSEEKYGLLNNLYSIKIEEADDFYLKLRNTFYSKGYFNLDRNKMKQSGLYSDLELNYIFKNSEVQKSIKDVVGKINTNYYSDNNVIYDLINDGQYNNEYNVVNSDKLLGIGKFEITNPFEIENEIKKAVVNSTSREDFNTKINNVTIDSFVDRYNNDENFANTIYEKYKNLKQIPVVEISGNSLVRELDTDTFNDLKETLKIWNDNTQIGDDLLFLTTIPNDIWTNNYNEVQSIIKSIEKEFAKFNIDIIGLSSIFDNYTQDEVITFIDDLLVFTDKINDNNVSDAEILDISDRIDLFLDRNINVKNDYNDSKGKTIVKLNNKINELEGFITNSLLKINDKYYQKIKKEENIDVLMDKAYTLITLNQDVFPKEAFYPSAFNSRNQFDASKLTNKVEILRDLNRFLNKEVTKYYDSNVSNDVLKSFVLHKYMFGLKDSVKDVVDLDTNFRRYVGFKGNFKYLTEDFIGDFKSEVLQEKLKNSSLYNQVLKYFEFKNNKITLTTDSEYILGMLKKILPNNKIYNDFKQYSLIVNDKVLNNLFINDTLETNLKDLNFYRTLYSNNPNLLVKSLIDYSMVADNVMVTTNSTANFVRTNDGLFELNDVVRGVSLYSKLEVNENVEYTDFTAKIKSEKVDASRYLTEFKDSKSNFVKSVSSYSIKTIKDRIDECG